MREIYIFNPLCGVSVTSFDFLRSDMEFEFVPSLLVFVNESKRDQRKGKHYGIEHKYILFIHRRATFFLLLPSASSSCNLRSNSLLAFVSSPPCHHTIITTSVATAVSIESLSLRARRCRPYSTRRSKRLGRILLVPIRTIPRTPIRRTTIDRTPMPMTAASPITTSGRPNSNGSTRLNNKFNLYSISSTQCSMRRWMRPPTTRPLPFHRPFTRRTQHRCASLIGDPSLVISLSVEIGRTCSRTYESMGMVSRRTHVNRNRVSVIGLDRVRVAARSRHTPRRARVECCTHRHRRGRPPRVRSVSLPQLRSRTCTLRPVPRPWFTH